MARSDQSLTEVEHDEALSKLLTKVTRHEASRLGLTRERRTRQPHQAKGGDRESQIEAIRELHREERRATRQEQAALLPLEEPLALLGERSGARRLQGCQPVERAAA